MTAKKIIPRNVLAEARSLYEQTNASAVAVDPASVTRQRVNLAHRVLVVAEREMDAIERVVAVLRPSNPLEAEHGARTLASVSRVLRDISLLTTTGKEMPADDDAADPVPRDVDEFRNELARRLRNLIAERTAHRRGSAGGAAGELVS